MVFLFLFFFKERIRGAKALPDRKESKKSNVDLDEENIEFIKPVVRRFSHRYHYDD